MKKILSLLLAMLMLVMPVFSMAEEAAAEEAAALLEGISAQSFATKYLAQGQALTTDVSFQLGEFLLSQIPQEYEAPVVDLLNALKIETVGQMADQQAQGALRLLLNDENAADIVVAVNQDGLYATSNLIGSTIVQVTPAQLKQLANQLVQQMIENGQLSQEQWDAVVKAYKDFQEDPEAFIASMIGDLDVSGLMEAVVGLLNFDLTPAEVTEKPEEVTIDAKYVMTIPLSKEGLKNVTTELAKLLWSMPIVQKVAPAAKVNDQPLTEESLTNLLNMFPDALAEDLVIDVYMTEDGNTVQALSDVKLNADGSEAQEKVNVIVELQEAGMHVAWNVQVLAEEEIALAGDMTVTQTADGGEMTYDVTATAKQGDVEFTPLQENIKAVWTEGENQKNLVMDVNAKATEEPGAEAIGLIYHIEDEERDLGDHAEEDVTVAVALDGLGDLMTIKAQAKTGLAEAYIITADAVQPVEMDGEAQEAFAGEIMQSLTINLFGLISKLPESVQPIVMQLLGAGE